MRLLLIQDRKSRVPGLIAALNREGFAVEKAALDRKEFGGVRFRGVDVVILDVQRFASSEQSILKQCCEEGVDAHVVILCGRNSLADKVEALDQGADDYLVKPIQTRELLARLRSLERRRHPPKIPTLCVHDLEIDRSARKVRRNGQQIRLTPNEFSLLELLARHSGQVVTRNMIWQHLYADHAKPSNVVDVYIRYLRLKIDKDFKQPLILTKWGQGYLLRA